MTRQRGFEEVPHTADWSMRVWAEDLPALFEEAARGMNALAGLQLGAGPRIHRTFEHEAGDRETLLVAFLSELVYLEEREQLGFDRFRIEFQGNNIRVDIEGAGVAGLAKPVKAVTFHNLRILETPTGFETQIVFDV